MPAPPFEASPQLSMFDWMLGLDGGWRGLHFAFLAVLIGTIGSLVRLAYVEGRSLPQLASAGGGG